jgi:hypothetical protein
MPVTALRAPATATQVSQVQRVTRTSYNVRGPEAEEQQGTQADSSGPSGQPGYRSCSAPDQHASCCCACLPACVRLACLALTLVHRLLPEDVKAPPAPPHGFPIQGAAQVEALMCLTSDARTDGLLLVVAALACQAVGQRDGAGGVVASQLQPAAICQLHLPSERCG